MKQKKHNNTGQACAPERKTRASHGAAERQELAVSVESRRLSQRLLENQADLQRALTAAYIALKHAMELADAQIEFTTGAQAEQPKCLPDPREWDGI